MTERRAGRPISAKPALDLPPPFSVVLLRKSGDAFAHAKAIAAEQGAGTLVYVGRFDLAEFAVILEPQEPLASARRALYAGLVALADALAMLAPPERPLTFDWPDAVRIDGGLVGGARLGWPDAASENEPPDWLVFAAMIRMVAMGGEEPGVRPLSSALEQEGFVDIGAARLVESFSRHLMATLDAWQEHGFDGVAKSYLARLPALGGARREIAESGDLLVRRMGRNMPERHSLLAALAQPSWLDPAGEAPRA